MLEVCVPYVAVTSINHRFTVGNISKLKCQQLRKEFLQILIHLRLETYLLLIYKFSTMLQLTGKLFKLYLFVCIVRTLSRFADFQNATAFVNNM